jgi:predicted nuclease of predicted toxin-antitoxin system
MNLGVRLLANENIPMPSVSILRTHGFEVLSVVEDIAGTADSIILDIAVREQCIILTFDRDYGELIYKYGRPAPLGVVYFRFDMAHPNHAAEEFLRMTEMNTITLEHRFTVTDGVHIRQRVLR